MVWNKNYEQAMRLKKVLDLSNKGFMREEAERIYEIGRYDEAMELGVVKYKKKYGL